MRVYLALVVVMGLTGCASSVAAPEPQESVVEREVVKPNERRRLSDWLGKDPLLDELRAEQNHAQQKSESDSVDWVRKDSDVVRRYLENRESHQVINGIPVVFHWSSLPGEAFDNSYNPELRRMGMRIGSDGQPKRIAGDGEIPATWEDLRRAQGFGR